MIMDVRNLPWIGAGLTVVDAADPTLVGRSGLVMDETRNTLQLLEGDRALTLGKAGVSFSIDGFTTVIDGSLMRQRPEDRTNRNYPKV
ncbi:MAG TPA: ribonuclease P protein subunit [Candidatus Poseidoniales archaeon]|nr:MAG TPA: ribonuclease P protein subunit [Candidatus Poseidoniales archaeon]